MRCRVAHRHELPALATIALSAFAEEPAYAHFYPFREIDPKTYYESILAGIEGDFDTPSTVIFVCELEEKDPSSTSTSASRGPKGEKLVGFVICKRHSTGEQRPSLSHSTNRDSEIHKEKLTQSARSQETIDYLDRERLRMLGSIDNTIELRNFAVLPEFHRSGVGKRLAQSIVVLAQSKGVDVFGNASHSGLSLYLRYGAEILGFIRLPPRTIRNEDGVEAQLPDVHVPIMRWRIRQQKPRI